MSTASRFLSIPFSSPCFPSPNFFIHPLPFPPSLLPQDVDLNSLGEAPSVLGLLLALYDPSHLGCLVTQSVAEQLCASMQSADPITVLAGKLEELSKDYRDMLKKLLRLFGKVSTTWR